MRRVPTLTSFAVLALASCLAGPGVLAGRKSAAPASMSVEDKARFDAAVALHDRGQYDAAAAAYRDLLKSRPEDPNVLCELANSLMAAGKAEEAIAPAERGLEQPGANDAFCSMILGVALDTHGELEKGEKVLRKAVKKSPDALMLHFNLGVNQSMQKRPEAAIGEFEEAIRISPSHPSSWRALAIAWQGERMRPRAFAAYARFLALEPTGPRAESAVPQLEKLLFQGIEHKGADPATGKDNTTVSLDPGKKDSEAALEVAMSMVAVTRWTDEWKDKNDAEFLAHACDSVLQVFEEMDNSGGRKDGFWSASVMPYFRAARAAGHMTTLSWDIRRAGKQEETRAWLEAHAAEVEAYRGWSAAWKPSPATDGH